MNKALVVSSLLAVVVVIASSTTLNASEQSVLHWEVNAALGLSGGPTPDQLTTGKPATFSEEEIQILKESEVAACKLYGLVLALNKQGTRGGEMDRFGQAGLALSRAQARLAWAQGKASAAVARAEQAVRFAEYVATVNKNAYETGRIQFDVVVAASELVGSTKLSLIKLKSALQRLGYDLADVPTQPQIDPSNPDSETDCTE